MIGIRQFDEDLVAPGRETLENDGISAGVCPMPRCVIDRHVDVSNSRGHGDRGRPKYRHDLQILRHVVDGEDAGRRSQVLDFP